MKASSLLFKRRISVLGLCLFIMVSLVKHSYRFFKWSINLIYKTGKWFRNYIHFVKAGYSYNDVYDLINNMTGREFEKFCYYLFKESGYDCKLTPPSCDYGRDVIISTDEGEIFVECKRYSDDGFQIGREIVQKLSGSMTMMNAIKGMIITTGKIHSNAYEAADMIGNIEILDMTDITKMIFKLDQKRIPYILMRSLDNNSKIIKLKPCVK